MLTHGSLFSGIGGFDLGFERAGIKTIWQVEIDGYCRKLLAQHFPDAQRFSDIRDCGAAWNFGRMHTLCNVDIIAGGFPCQDISNAGYKVGIEGARSGLWAEYARIVGELRPKVVVVENVAALLGRGMGRVLGDLAEVGYDAEWQTIPACHFGLPHLRERVWIVAYPHGQRLETLTPETFLLPKADCHWRNGYAVAMGGTEVFRTSPDSGTMVAESILVGGRTGIPNRVDRIKGLGNSIVPQIAEWIGRRIMESFVLRRHDSMPENPSGRFNG